MKSNLQLVAGALLEKTTLEVVYDGKRRKVEPHAVGVTKDFNLVTRVYQVAPEPGWRLLNIDGLSQVEVVADSFEPRITEGYKMRDRGMSTIIAEQFVDA